LSGPLASHLLIDAGAEVIKVEHPRVGDGNRGLKRKIAGLGDHHVSLNPGATSLAISTKSPHWNEVVAASARWADAVIVGARPSDARRRGLDFATVREAKPDIVYCLISGYGLRGPWVEYTAHGQNIDAMAGRVDVDCEGGQPSTRPGWRSAGSSLAGVFAALGLLTAVIRRDRGGGAQFVHTSLWNAAMWWSWRDLNALANEGRPWSEYGDLGSRYAMWTTADRRVLLVCPIERKFWERFCDLLELPSEWRQRGEWEGGSDFGYDDERGTIAARMARRGLQEWVRLLEPTDIPFAPVLDLEEALESDHAIANNVFEETTVDGRPVRVAASPVRVYADEAAALADGARSIGPPPRLGEHSADVLERLGLGELVGHDLTG
jgi:crotonobetainyl-CoA:carnitine CoA-transferase CaiB-like acyl-CoA transferase